MENNNKIYKLVTGSNKYSNKQIKMNSLLQSSNSRLANNLKNLRIS